MRKLVWLGVAALVAGCGARQQVSLGPNGAAEVRIEMALLPAFSAYVAELSGQADRNAPVIDTLRLKRELAAFPALSVVSAVSTRERIELHFKLADLGDFLRGRPDVFDGIASVSRRGAARRLEFELDREKIRRFLQFAPAGQRRLLEALLPPRHSALSAGQYADYLAWAFEEYAEPKRLLLDLLELKLRISVAAQGRISAQSGGRLVDGAAVFELPILELLSSETTRRYSVDWE